MIETPSQLRDWLVTHKVPRSINAMAFAAWEEALTSPTIGKIRKYYVLCGMDMHIKDDISWSSIAELQS